MMGWFNWYGLILMSVLMLPNLAFMAAHSKDGFDGSYHNPLVEGLEQVGRFGSFALMVFNIPGLYRGFWFNNGLTVYLAVDGALILAYCAIWIICWHKPGMFRSIALSVLPSLMLLFSGVALMSYPLILFAALFAVCHITISVKNAAK